MPELRTAVMIVVEASWQDVNDVWQRASGRIEDKSSGGACIRLTKPVEVGTRLRIDSRFEQFAGVVRYCRNEGRDFIIGVQRDRAPTIAVATPAASPPSKKEAPAELQAGPTPEARAAVPPQSHRPRTERPSEISARREKDIRDWRRASRRRSPSGGVRAEGMAIGLARGKEPVRERKSMKQKWLELASWNKNRSREHEGRNDEASVETAEVAFAEEGPSVTSGKERVMPIPTHNKEKNSSREVPTFQVELLPLEDVFRLAGVTSPRGGYSVSKVIEMTNSEHIRGLSKEMKRAAVLMALDAAGVSVDQIQRDAKARQNALDSYEASQKKQAEAEWIRKAEEITQIQSELESIKAHYTARISRCNEALARDKTRFNEWVTAREQESKNMSEAVELCLNDAAAEAAAPAPMSAAAGAASVQAGPASAKPQ